MKYLTSEQIAKKWKISDRQVRSYCSAGRILGALFEKQTWYIPYNASKPERQRRTVQGSRTLLNVLKEEKEHRLHGGIYHKLQIELTYNSNHMEGSKLSHEQTRLIFETKTLGASSKSTNIDDIIETVSHFKCLDLVIDHAQGKLTESLIKELHRTLKQNTSDSFLSWFKVGDYKAMKNEVGGKETTSPEEVSQKMKELLTSYNQKEKHSIEEIIDFHYKFECIHPFQDGNGRIGRLIMFKECLKNRIVPILIQDEFKDFYYRGLTEYKYEKGYLIDTCLHGQDIVKSYLDYFEIKY